jgi:hypothetical protein
MILEALPMLLIPAWPMRIEARAGACCHGFSGAEDGPALKH